MTKAVRETISWSESDPSAATIHYNTPLAKALLGAEEGEEVEVLVGSYLRRAVVERITANLQVGENTLQIIS